MKDSILLRGVSALVLMLPSVAALAQEALPTIDVAGDSSAQRRPAEGPGDRFTGYAAANQPASSTKDGIDVMRNPISVQVVTRQVLDDQQAISVQDAIVGNVSGVQPSGDTFYDGFTIRGFDSSSIFRNNLATPNLTHLQTANLQSIEVLKGPAAMLYGRLEPGGAVNLITKRPLDYRYYSIEEQAGSWGLTRTSVDATGPLTEDKTWLYRLNVSFNHADSFRNFVTNQDAFIAPTLSWRPTEQLRFNLDFEYQNTSFVSDADTTLPAVGNRPASLPVGRYLQSPAVTRANPSRLERGLVSYDWTFDLDKDWSLTNRFMYTDLQWAQRLTDISSFDASTGATGFSIWDVNAHRAVLNSNLDLKGKLETGPFRHEILLGADYRYDENHDFGYCCDGSSITPLNAYAPAYATTGYIKPANNFYWDQRQSWKGIYGQDMISFLDDRVHVLLGGRHDWASYGYGSSSNSFQEARSLYNSDTGAGFQNAVDHAWSPRLGVVLQPQQWLSFYANYTRSFGSTNGIPSPGNLPFTPERGLQWEGGVKAELLDKRLVATLAYYDITKSGVVQSIPGTQFSRPVGLVESRGVELDVTGRIDDNWSVIGNYSYDDARIIADANGTPLTGGQEGNRLQNVPRHSGSLWVKYDASSQLQGLSLGAGVFAVGQRQGDNQNDFQLPGYARVDTLILYRLPASLAPWAKNVSLQFNVKNLLNTTYYLHSYDRFSIAPGAPRTFLASIRAEF
ncbi:TonB-dependent siderophore receptor [Methylosinus sporium]|uniref:TonB-dependent siderophore receptor n=1 Tax=Methylosinus sporium TaxID=428 RepID=UPI00383B393D